MVLAGLQKTYGTAQHPKKAATLEDIRQMIHQIPASRLGIRDRPLLLIGFAGAFRRSELAGLQREDIEMTPDGLRVTLRRSKTDQTGQGRGGGYSLRIAPGDTGMAGRESGHGRERHNHRICDHGRTGPCQ